jgi:hypothetical protein
MGIENEDMKEDRARMERKARMDEECFTMDGKEGKDGRQGVKVNSERVSKALKREERET